MQKIKPTVFRITKEEIEDIFNEMIEEERLEGNIKLNRNQLINVLACVKGDEFLAKDIRTSIRGSIFDVLED